MKTAVRQLKAEKGFSLVELMIVVAIIGILATIAIPNFQRFQAKARQSEARGNLTALYTAQKAFQQEWSQYFADFRAVGFQPEGDLRYRVGFLSAGTVPSPTNYSGPGGAANAVMGPGATAVAYNTNQSGICGTTANDICRERFMQGTTSPALPPGSEVTSAIAFVAGAAGDIDGDTDLDTWTVNNNKVFTQVLSDL